MLLSEIKKPENSLEQDVPEWMRQRALIYDGKAKWEDFSFKERTCKGWLLPYLLEIDAMFSDRWDYWSRTVANQAPLDEPIPYIDFLETPDHETMKNLTDCMKPYARYGFRFSDFLEWILWGFGAQKERAKISDEANEHWYRTFNLGLLLKNPHDYLGVILSEEKSGYWNNPNAFYPTPHSVCQLMVQMQVAGDQELMDLKNKSVCDPCVGTGRMLMYASNYCLHLYGQDIDYACVMACKINGFLYVPWMVKRGLEMPETPVDIEPEKPIKVINLKAFETGRTSMPVQLELF